MAGAAPLEVFGDDYPTPDGTCVRDYIHVTDLARAHVLALERLRAGGPSRVYNLGNGRGFSVREVIDAAEAVDRPGGAAPAGAAPAGGSAGAVADATLAGRELGWAPERPALADQIADAWAWMRRADARA